MRHGIKIALLALVGTTVGGCAHYEPPTDFLGVITAYASGKPVAVEHAIFSTQDKCRAATKEQVATIKSDPDNAQYVVHGYCFPISRE